MNCNVHCCNRNVLCMEILVIVIRLVRSRLHDTHEPVRYPVI
jgi:hypothetical protein